MVIYSLCFIYLEDNRIKAGTAGGVEAVVKAINTHIDNTIVCENGCGALRNMTFNNGKKHIQT